MGVDEVVDVLELVVLVEALELLELLGAGVDELVVVVWGLPLVEPESTTGVPELLEADEPDRDTVPPEILTTVATVPVGLPAPEPEPLPDPVEPLPEPVEPPEPLPEPVEDPELRLGCRPATPAPRGKHELRAQVVFGGWRSSFNRSLRSSCAHVNHRLRSGAA